MDDTEMWCIRRLGNIKWMDRITNDFILQMLATKNTTVLVNTVEKIAKYLGHVKIRDNLLSTDELKANRSPETRETWMTTSRS